MTYKQAYDKIIDAYFKDEIKPINPSFCFCGTLCDNSKEWFTPFSDPDKHRFHCDSHGYTGIQFSLMEAALFDGMINAGLNPTEKSHPNYEAGLFAGMCAALNVLKEIHLERGEDVDGVPALTKRELNPAQ